MFNVTELESGRARTLHSVVGIFFYFIVLKNLYTPWVFIGRNRDKLSVAPQDCAGLFSKGRIFDHLSIHAQDTVVWDPAERISAIIMGDFKTQQHGPSVLCLLPTHSMTAVDCRPWALLWLQPLLFLTPLETQQLWWLMRRKRLQSYLHGLWSLTLGLQLSSSSATY